MLYCRGILASVFQCHTVCLKLSWSVWLSVGLSFYLSVCLSGYMKEQQIPYLSVWIHKFCFLMRFAFVCQCHFLSWFIIVCLTVSWSVYLSVCLAIYLFFCLFVCLAVCLSVCLCVWIHEFCKEKKNIVIGSQNVRFPYLRFNVMEKRKTFIYKIVRVIEQDSKLYMTDVTHFFSHKTVTATSI